MTTDQKKPSPRILAAELLAASFLVLFLELTLIRWTSGQVRVLAYFPNLILISAFLGLGIGCLWAGRGSLLKFWPPALVLYVLAVTLLGKVAFTNQGNSEHLWLLYYDLPPQALVVDGVQYPIMLIFMLSVLLFAPLGQLVAERLQIFRSNSLPLLGYCWDIGGSIMGVALFALCAFLLTFPVVWFVVVLLTAIPFLPGIQRRHWRFSGRSGRGCDPGFCQRARQLVQPLLWSQCRVGPE